MIDLHCHILPGLDDGAQDIYDTLEMAELAQQSGITAIAATPHCNIPGRYQNYFNEYVHTFQKVQQTIRREGMKLELLPGAEAFGTPQLPRLLQEGKVMTLNQSHYLLMEFAFDEDPEYVNGLLDEVRQLKAIPVIAHAERYKFVQREPNLVYRWRKAGYPVQINKGSFQGRFGESAMETAYLLMNHHLVSVVASDAHSPYQRTPYMAEVYEELLTEYPENYLEMLFAENPKRICRDQPILSYQAREVQSV